MSDATPKSKPVASSKAQSTSVIPAATTPLEVLTRAVSQGADVQTLERLMDLQERWESSNAKKAFAMALRQARSRLPDIVKDETCHMGGGKGYKYESLPTLQKQIDPVLDSFGMSYRFESRTLPNGHIEVTCYLMHDDGHTESATLSGPPDAGPGRNAVKAIGSTATYLMRYTLKLVLGIAAGADDDGSGGGTKAPPRIPNSAGVRLPASAQTEDDGAPPPASSSVAHYEAVEYELLNAPDALDAAREAFAECEDLAALKECFAFWYKHPALQFPADQAEVTAAKDRRKNEIESESAQ